MPASTLNLNIDQGATFSQVVAAGLAHSGSTTRAVMRRYFGGGIVATFACTAVDVSGNTTVSLTAAETAVLVAPPHVRHDERKVPIGFWELEVIGATVTRTHQGSVTLSRGGQA